MCGLHSFIVVGEKDERKKYKLVEGLTGWALMTEGSRGRAFGRSRIIILSPFPSFAFSTLSSSS